METTLVVGATGQLGFATVQALVARGRSVRALIRDSKSAATFEALGVETILGDLTDRESIRQALTGISRVIATANSSIPTRPADTFESVEDVGYRNLIAAAVNANVKRFVYASARFPTNGFRSRFAILKQQTEQRIRTSGLNHVIFEADAFMDVAFAMMGSRIPLSHSHNPTVLRPFQFSLNYYKGIENSIDQKHVAKVPGDGTTRHAFICISDVSRALVAASVDGPAGTFTLAGPESLSYLDIVRLYEQLLSISLKVSNTPAMVFRLLATLLGPFNPAGANLMWLNWLSATQFTLPDPATPKAFDLELTTAETFLREKFRSLAPHP